MIGVPFFVEDHRLFFLSDSFFKIFQQPVPVAAVLELHHMTHGEFKDLNHVVDFFGGRRGLQPQNGPYLPLSGKIEIFSNGGCRRDIGIQTQSRMIFRRGAEDKTAQHFSLHTVLEQVPIQTFIEPLPGSFLGPVYCGDIVFCQELGHQPIGHDHDLGNQHPCRAFPVDPVHGDFPIVADPDIDVREGYLDRSGRQSLLPEFFSDITEDNDFLIVVPDGVDIVIGQLVLDLDHARYDFIIDDVAGLVYIYQSADGRTQLTGFEAAEIFGQTGGQHGDLLIGHVNGTCPVDGFPVDGISFFDKVSHIDDMNAQAIMIAKILDTDGIIEIEGRLTVDGHGGKHGEIFPLAGVCDGLG